MNLPQAQMVGTAYRLIDQNQFMLMPTAASSVITIWNDWVAGQTGTTNGPGINTYYPTTIMSGTTGSVWYGWQNAAPARGKYGAGGRGSEGNKINRRTNTNSYAHRYLACPVLNRDQVIRHQHIVAKIKKRKRDEADALAKALLISMLNEQQQQDYKEHGWFHVDTADGTKRFRIRRGIAGNVDRIDLVTNYPIARYCIHPPLDMPAEDVMLSQKLLIEADLAEFERIANVSRV